MLLLSFSESACQWEKQPFVMSQSLQYLSQVGNNTISEYVEYFSQKAVNRGLFLLFSTKNYIFSALKFQSLRLRKI